MTASLEAGIWFVRHAESLATAFASLSCMWSSGFLQAGAFISVDGWYVTIRSYVYGKKPHAARWTEGGYREE